jgi:hypothetical protein
MALDRCLPGVLLAENRWRHTNHYIIISFFIVTTSIQLITGGKIDSIAAVYTIAFLGVMSLFALGNMLLKYKRGKLPRLIRASWKTVLLGLFSVLAGLAGNIFFNPKAVTVFLLYFVFVVLLVTSMFVRVKILRYFLYFLSRTPLKNYFATWIQAKVREVNRSVKLVFFAKNEDLAVLNKAVLYVRDNELSDFLCIVHFTTQDPSTVETLRHRVEMLDEMYPKLRIDLVVVKGEFNPQTVEALSARLSVPKNFMFVACPSDRSPHKISQFGGVRVVTH